MSVLRGRVLNSGTASGSAVRLDEPLSMWGGLDPATGTIVDRHHPQLGESLAGTILVMTAGRGSSSSSSVLAEAIRAGTSPAAIVLLEADEIIVLGALIADLLDARSIPVIQLDSDAFAGLTSGDQVHVRADGRIAVQPKGG